MPWQSVFHAEQAIVEVTYTGHVTTTELQEALQEIIALGRRHRTLRVLADCAALQGGHSVVDLYFLADSLKSMEEASGMKEALLLPRSPESAQAVAFWETICRNRGLRARAFQDRAAALAWLRE
jgi:hypothetical protein